MDRRRRAGGAGTRCERGDGAADRARSWIIDPHRGEGRGAGVADQERPGDRVAEVGRAVAVDVVDRCRLGDGRRRRLRDNGVGRRRGGRVCTPVRVISRGRRCVADVPGIDVGLTDHIGSGGRAGGRGTGSERRHGAGDRPGLGVVDPDRSQCRRAGVRDQERPLDRVAEVSASVAVHVGHGRRLGHRE